MSEHEKLKLSFVSECHIDHEPALLEDVPANRYRFRFPGLAELNLVTKIQLEKDRKYCITFTEIEEQP